MTIFEASIKFDKSIPVNAQIDYMMMNVLLMKSNLEKLCVRESWQRNGANTMSIMATLTDKTQVELSDKFKGEEMHNLMKKIRIVKNWD